MIKLTMKKAQRIEFGKLYAGYITTIEYDGKTYTTVCGIRFLANKRYESCVEDIFGIEEHEDTEWTEVPNENACVYNSTAELVKDGYASDISRSIWNAFANAEQFFGLEKDELSDMFDEQ